jgi:hypothetical protein
MFFKKINELLESKEEKKEKEVVAKVREIIEKTAAILEFKKYNRVDKHVEMLERSNPYAYIYVGYPEWISNVGIFSINFEGKIGISMNYLATHGQVGDLEWIIANFLKEKNKKLSSQYFSIDEFLKRETDKFIDEFVNFMDDFIKLLQKTHDFRNSVKEERERTLKEGVEKLKQILPELVEEKEEK